MIRLLLAGAARVLFNAAVLAFALGALLVYAAYRLLRSSVAGSPGRPVSEAGFATLTAVVVLAQAIICSARASQAAPAGPSVPAEEEEA